MLRAEKANVRVGVFNRNTFVLFGSTITRSFGSRKYASESNALALVRSIRYVLVPESVGLIISTFSLFPKSVMFPALASASKTVI